MKRNDYAQMFDDAKAGGARGSHWPGLDDILKRDLVSLLNARKQLHEEVPSYPGARVPPPIQRRLDEVSREIETINQVRRDVAAEMQAPDTDDGIWGC